MCTCDTESIFAVNTDTGLCTTVGCESENAICMNEAQCSGDMEDPRDEDATCQCRNWDFEENCELRE